MIEIKNEQREITVPFSNHAAPNLGHRNAPAKNRKEKNPKAASRTHTTFTRAHTHKLAGLQTKY